MVRKKNQFIPGDFKAHFFLMKLKKNKIFGPLDYNTKKKKGGGEERRKDRDRGSDKKIAKSVSN